MKNNKMKNIKFKAIVPLEVECNAWVPEEFDENSNTFDLEQWLKNNITQSICSTNVSGDIETNLAKGIEENGLLKVCHEPIVETLQDLLNIVSPEEVHKVYLNYDDIGLMPLNSSSYYVMWNTFYFEGNDFNTQNLELTNQVFIDAIDAELNTVDWLDSNIYDCDIVICRNDSLKNGCFDPEHPDVKTYSIDSVEKDLDGNIIFNLKG